ncbi:MAG: hypothetical protein ACRESZ_09365 [Methylococcales bacterium]
MQCKSLIITGAVLAIAALSTWLWYSVSPIPVTGVASGASSIDAGSTDVSQWHPTLDRDGSSPAPGSEAPAALVEHPAGLLPRKYEPAIGYVHRQSRSQFAGDDLDSAAPAEALETGSEEERYSALIQAHDEGIPLPVAIVQETLRSDDSERVRAQAFEYLLESSDTSRMEMEEAVAIAEHDVDPALRDRAQELRAQLEQLAISEAEAAAVQGNGTP